MIKTIIFDLGSVIVNVDKTNLYRKWAEKSGKNVDEIIDYYENSPAGKKFERGKLNSKEFYERVVRELNLKMNFDDFKKIYCNIFTLDSDVAKLIQKLKKNFRLVLLSNTDALHFEYAKNKYKILDVFDDYVLSYEVGHSKPNPLIFWTAIKKSKTAPFNCVYFDDIAAFVFVARLMGIKAFQFKGYEKLISDFGKVNISSKVL